VGDDGRSGASGFQVERRAAEIYASHFVPAIFAEWAPRMLEAGEVAAGERVLDLACGTGVVARSAGQVVGRTGRVVGLDRNADMLAVAKSQAPDVLWCRGDAGALPFPDACFDVVLSLAALMFFPDPVQALREVKRVLRAGGRAAVQVWGASPGYDRVADAIEEQTDVETANRFMAPFSLSRPSELVPLFGRAGFGSGTTRTSDGAARFPSLEALVRTEIGGSPLAGNVEVAPLIASLREKLAAFCAEDGSVTLPMQGHIVIVYKGSSGS
jgi:SAM-dependent methyltransferase